MTRSLCRLAAVLVLLLAVGLGVTAEQTAPCTIFVQPGESIQAAIDAAPEGAVICLGGRWYDEYRWNQNLTIAKSLTLRGQDLDTTILRRTRADQPLIRITSLESSGVVCVAIENITVDGKHGGPLAPLEHAVGILVEGTASATISGCTVIGNNDGYGIELAGACQATVSKCTISGNEWFGILVHDSALAAIRDCSISANAFGIGLTDAAQATVYGCSISGNSAGIELVGTSAATIMDSLFFENGEAMRCAGSTRGTITCCTVSNGGMYGIRFLDSAIGTITRCTVSRTRGGIRVEGSSQVTVTGCLLSDNDDGIGLGGSANASIVECTISGSEYFGVALGGRQCFSIAQDFAGSTIDEEFIGHISGHGNVIPVPSEPGGNLEGAVCPEVLSFLMTPEGGELDRRASP